MEIIKTKFPESQAKNWIPLDANKVEFIFIHHPMAKNATIEQINSWHITNGWSGGIGYNEYIRKDGKAYIGRGDYIGAHVHGMNSRSYGICLEGNYEVEESPSDFLYEITAKRVIEAQKRFPKAATILPHSARQNTQCPGKNFSMSKLYDKITELTKKDISLDEALRIIADKKITLSPNYWKNNINKLEYLENLIINMANYVKNA
jgi:hypothetical protein